MTPVGVLVAASAGETLLFVLVLGLICFGGYAVSPVFLTPRNFTNLVTAVIEVAIDPRWR